MMKVLITGGAGYLGSVLVPMIRHLMPHYRVTVLDTFAHGVPSLAQCCSDHGVRIFRGDARDATALQEVIDVDAVIPLAALVGAPMCDADRIGCWTTNTDAIELLCKQLPRDVPIIIPISNSGYGIGEAGKECTEESPLNPVSLYGESKVAAEKLVMARGNAVSLRLATVFGMSPRMRMDLLVNDFVWQAVTRQSIVLFEAHVMRNYVHVRDVALAFIHVLNEWSRMKDNIYNVGDSRANMSKLELANTIGTHIDFSIQRDEFTKDKDRRDYIVSNAKFEATGWKPQYTLNDGIRELIKGFQMFKRVTHGNA